MTNKLIDEIRNNLDNNFKITKYEDTKIYNLYRLYLDNPYGMQKRLFEGED